MKLEFVVKNFLKKEGYLGQPLLLALSGGPDSMALFHLLLQAKVLFEVAHVDHRWRVTSEEEAKQLQKICALHHIPFHLTTLRIDPQGVNVEDRCRQERLGFFKHVLALRGLQAVLCAHHADDQAETVLKRALEGSSLAKLSALQQIKKMGDLVILRPLLTVTKKELIYWLQERGIAFFVDATNEEGKFLRGRMRSEMIPVLTQLFGKNVQKGLCRLAQSAFELNRYLNECLDPLLQEVKEIECGYQLILPKEIRSSSFLCKMALKRFFTKYGIIVSNELLNTCVLHLQHSKKKKREEIKRYHIELEGEKIIIRRKIA